MKVLVTGASGFVGSNYCAASGEELFLLDRATDLSVPSQVSSIRAKGLRSGGGDLSQLGVEVIVHIAAAGVQPNDRDLGTLVKTNTNMAFHIVELAARIGAKAVVIVGSCSEYSASTTNRKSLEEDSLETEKPYGATKASGSILSLMAGSKLNVKVAVARLFNVYGPGERSYRLLPTLIEKLARSEPVSLSIGTQIRDFLYVEDACSAVDVLAQTMLLPDSISGVYNVCTGHGTSVRGFAEIAAEVLGKNTSLLLFGNVPLRPDDVPYLVGENQKILHSTSWRPRFDVRAGILKSLSHYLNRMTPRTE